MKKTLKRFLSRATAALLCLTALVSAMGCQNKQADLWQSAAYTADTSLGSGNITFPVEVEADGKTVCFTVSASAETVGDALLDAGLIEGEEGPYGLYVKTVNGITADYDADQSYWAFYINGEYGMTGVDATPIVEGEVYRFVYSK